MKLDHLMTNSAQQAEYWHHSQRENVDISKIITNAIKFTSSRK